MLPFQLLKMREIIQLQRTSVGKTRVATPFQFNLSGLLTTLIMKRHRVVEEQCLGSQAQAAGARPSRCRRELFVYKSKHSTQRRFE